MYDLSHFNNISLIFYPNKNIKHKKNYVLKLQSIEKFVRHPALVQGFSLQALQNTHPSRAMDFSIRQSILVYVYCIFQMDI